MDIEIINKTKMLRKLMDNIRSKPVSVKFLRERLPNNVPLFEYSQLKGKHRSELFKNRVAIVVIIPMLGTRAGHYIVLLPRKNHISYFSSLGNGPFDELKKLMKIQTDKNVVCTGTEKKIHVFHIT